MCPHHLIGELYGVGSFPPAAHPPDTATRDAPATQARLRRGTHGTNGRRAAVEGGVPEPQAIYHHK